MKILFFISIFSIYSLLHLYVFLKIRGAFSFGGVITFFLITFMVFMVGAPFVVRLLERFEFDAFARIISYIGYTWMGLVFLFFFCSVVIDLYRILLYVMGIILRKDFFYFLTPSPGFAFFAALLPTLAITVLGYYEARSIRTETVVIRSPKIPEEIGTITIAQISDVHLGLIVRHERLNGILNAVKRENPDILVSTGDLVDGQIDNLTGLAELLKAVNPSYGKFAITGNHEFYAGLDQSLRFLESAGFTVLRGETRDAAGVITVAGIDDPTGKYFGFYKGVSEDFLLSQNSNERFVLLLKHIPSVKKEALGLFDLQLSGHTHKGQIFPFSLVTRLFFPNHSGLIDLSHGSKLYVSRGSGTWGPPIRFLSPPEVTIIKLVHMPKNEHSTSNVQHRMLTNS
ncbi:MAG: metallophosphoesterase [Thermodesulfobacteriota bacterium]|nr:metallophosphoesterase [Thermodesulfobacteriota bacterium]